MKKLLLLFGIIFITGCTVQSVNEPQLGADPIVKLEGVISDVDFQKIEWVEPKTDAEWAEDNKNEQFNRKFDYQLAQMLENQNKKLIDAQDELFKIEKYPGAYALDLFEQGDGQEEIDAEILSTQEYWRWKVEKHSQSIKRLEKEIELRDTKVIDRADEIIGTTYYIDFGCATPGDGTTATCNGDADDSFIHIGSFTTAARSAGDVGTVRRGTATTTFLVDLAFTSDGAIGNPIVLEADYDDSWSDFANSAQTYTPIPGSKDMEASATIAGIAANDWIYVTAEDQRAYAYEVETVSGTTLSLYLPYKGKKTGSGHTLVVMPDAPIWGDITTAGPAAWAITGDLYWSIQGMDLRTSDSADMLDLGATVLQVKDTIFQSNGGADAAINFGSFNSMVRISKSRIFDMQISAGSVNPPLGKWTNILWDSNGDLSNTIYQTSGTGDSQQFENIEIINQNATGDWMNTGATSVSYNSNFRSVIWDESGLIVDHGGATIAGLAIEDLNGIGRNFVYDSYVNSSPADDHILKESTTTASLIRSGGGNSAMIVHPTTAQSSIWDYSKIKLFEYPIYADTTSKQYDVYFSSTSTGHWTADPTAVELYLEADYWGHATEQQRITSTSTSLIDFNGSTAWQALSITVQPSQTGTLYLRGYYGKPREAGLSNAFYMDTQPVIQ